jgi:hypothetical protein
MKNSKQLTREEMKNVTGGMKWLGCPSANVLDCRPNPYGYGYMPLPAIPLECYSTHHYMSEHERDMACLAP